ncbi:c-type cytochrome [Paenibacillus sp. GCM10027627]|uniref:c-type cytochrome n=1 Tax=unclassified Paenibacillus TaxID=185978 RepID=UPI003644B1DA
MRYSKWLMVVATMVLAVSLSACGGGNKAEKKETGMNKGTTNESGNGSANAGGGTVDAAAAEAIYKKSCVGCHAVDLAGGVGPNLQKVGGKLSAEQIKSKISGGGGGMPPYKDQLTAAEIDTLSNWLASMK